MADLTPDDVRRWDPAAVLQVFQVANGRADTMQRFGDDLGQVGQGLADWEGEAGTAFHTSLDRARTDIEADGRESAQVASAVCDAWEDVQITKGMMSEVDETASGLGFTITNDWKVDIAIAGLLMGSTEAQLEQQILQSELDTVKTKAHTTDHELATAMRAAVGDAKLDQNGREIPQAPAPGDATTTPADQLPLSTKGGHQPFPTEATKDNGSPDISHHLTDNLNPSPLLAGLSADEWHERLAHFKPGDPLPDPRTPTGDKTIDSLAFAAGQQNTTYAWGANKSKDGPSQGEGDTGQGANQNHDWDRYGYDCGGLVRYSVQQGAGFDVGQGTDAIDSNPNFTRAQDLSLVPGSAVIGKAQPGDVLVFRPNAGAGTEHTGIYIGNGYMMNAPDSGNPVRVDPVAGHGLTDILRMP
ncbi:MAG TPA: NlpC/P60 family protein [Mycobacterium sp.]|nr:NlpC/P60 family protein [Mycobacterium sp.]